MKPAELDEYPIHQTPLSMSRVASSDKNFYDRCYFNAHDRTGEVFFISGMGFYPNLGVKDAFATVRRGDRQWALRLSDALDTRTTDQAVGPYQIEVVQPLQQLRLVCDCDDLGFDLTWNASFPAILEQPHLLLAGNKPTLDAQRFAQLGSWAGTLHVAGDDIRVDSNTWVGARDRSWGIRPIGDPDPPGRTAEQPLEGFWWMYVPLRFDDFAVVVILQEEPDGYRTLNDARRVFPDGRVEQLGWPRVEIDYRSSTRHPERARLHLTTPSGDPLLVEVETLSSIAMHIGAGYGGDPEWSHGQWRGPKWSSTSVYDLNDPELIGRMPWGACDHSARATCAGRVGWGMLEHATIGRHDPTGMRDWSAVAP